MAANMEVAKTRSSNRSRNPRELFTPSKYANTGATKQMSYQANSSKLVQNKIFAANRDTDVDLVLKH